MHIWLFNVVHWETIWNNDGLFTSRSPVVHCSSLKKAALGSQSMSIASLKPLRLWSSSGSGWTSRSRSGPFFKRCALAPWGKSSTGLLAFLVMWSNKNSSSIFAGAGLPLFTYMFTSVWIVSAWRSKLTVTARVLTRHWRTSARLLAIFRCQRVCYFWCGDRLNRFNDMPGVTSGIRCGNDMSEHVWIASNRVLFGSSHTSSCFFSEHREATRQLGDACSILSSPRCQASKMMLFL